MKSARSRHSLRRTLLLSTVVAVSLLSASAFAADSTTSTTSTSKTSTSTSTPTSTSTSTSTTSTKTSTSSTTTSTSSSSMSTSSSSSSSSSATTSSSSSSSSASSSVSSSGTGIPVYPAPTVPPTENAPFMQQSTMPDGTVFIAVGAILGTFALAVLIWRAIVAYLLHRSIARAALAQHAANDKAAFPPQNKTFYKNADHHARESLYGTHMTNSASMGGGFDGTGLGGTSSGRGVRRTQRGATPSATPSQTNLFFSPTAPGASGMGGGGLGGMSAGMSGMAGASGVSNRESRYLPSGFYAAGSGSPAAAGTPSTGPSANMSNLNLRPDSRGTAHGRMGGAGGVTPPESPAFGARSTPVNNVSHSSINLTALQRPASGRAPSAFLDDLLDENPGMFPPSGTQHDHSPGRI